MARRKFIFFMLLIGSSLFVGSCVKEGTDGPDSRSSQQPQAGAAVTPDAGLVTVIKKGKLVNYQATTVGNAFDSYSYLKNKEWKEEQLKSGHFIVNFIGWFDSDTLNDKNIGKGITGRGLEVKFVIDQEGFFYVFTITELDRKSDGGVSRNQILENDTILSSIYANKKLNL